METGESSSRQAMGMESPSEIPLPGYKIHIIKNGMARRICLKPKPEDEEDESEESLFPTPGQLPPPHQRAPLLAIENGQEDHGRGVKGIIVRMKLQDFLAYDCMELHAGPNINFIVGSCGSGKSTIIAAICLGLGGPLRLLKQSMSLGDYVRDGARFASIEIELFNPTGLNFLIRRIIKLEDRGTFSYWYLNSARVVRRVVMGLVNHLGIHLDNLCSFLPQDCMEKFVLISPEDRFQSFLKVAENGELYLECAELEYFQEQNDFQQNDKKQKGAGRKQAKKNKSPKVSTGIKAEKRESIEKTNKKNGLKAQAICLQLDEANKDVELYGHGQPGSSKHHEQKDKFKIGANDQQKKRKEYEKSRALWITRLQNSVQLVNNSFSKLFNAMRYEGAVVLTLPRDKDYFENYGLSIMVRFRQSKELKELDNYHSRGERSITTALYFLSLQDSLNVPFRIFDQINQGMDDMNEGRVFHLFCQGLNGTQTPQYFISSTKMLHARAVSPIIDFHMIFGGAIIQLGNIKDPASRNALSVILTAFECPRTPIVEKDASDSDSESLAEDESMEDHDWEMELRIKSEEF